MRVLRRIKRQLFGLLRRYFVTRRIWSILNYLHCTEVREGLDTANLSRVLIVAPHPDDEAIGCGGTIRLMSSRGIRCDVVFVTCGEKSFHAFEGNPPDAIQEKKALACNAAELLGITEVFFLEVPDGTVHEYVQETDALWALLDRNQYQRVFCPWANDSHSDHAAAFRLLRNVLGRLQASPQIWFYEVWNPLVANHVVNIDGTINQKMRAIHAYRKVENDVDYLAPIFGLSRYRSLLLKNSLHAEAFLVMDKSQLVGPFSQLVQSVFKSITKRYRTSPLSIRS